MDKEKLVILASASPRRAQLIKNIFPVVTILPQDVDETITCDKPEEIVKELSIKKLNNLDKTYEDALIISADTIVYFNNKIYGKPKDKNDAFNMIKQLSNHTHDVYTGVCVAYKGKRDTFFVKSQVIFKDIDDLTINKYIDMTNPLDKAGAYGIQDNELVLSYEGSYSNIVGLPLEELTQRLKKIGAIE